VKETAFLYAISSAGLVHEISRACAQGRLDRCSCDESEQLENTKTWLWGGCGDNIRFGSKFTNKFLKRAKGFEKDIRARVDEHNSRAGIKIVRELVNKTCKCHGLSGSCTVETCWQQLAPFKEVGRVLKNKYEKSVRVIGTTNDATTDQTQLMKQRPHAPETQLMKQRPHPPETSQQNLSVPVGLTELIHIDDSPDFCKASRYSPGTYGRLCNKGQNCGSICCGRGHNVQKRMYKRPCKCEVIWCCSLKCKECVEEEDVYLCK
ncbi:protein Wnt-9a-like, partial [Physella acuta]|uniref:protein Wnt-9a-like n=1 Tax=Physella acuta TaxID=109671 RepID=UPI0027DD7980